jgi:hypothetical protein
VRQSTLIKVAVGLAAVAGLGVLVVRSMRNVAAEPYTLARADLAGWTVAVDPEARESGVLLALWPPGTLAPPLFRQVFARSGISLSGPNRVAMPLVLQGEFDRALTGSIAPEALVALARDSGLESIAPTPLCMASRRESQPGSTRQVFYVRFEHPPLGAFRRQLAARVRVAGASASSFEPGNLSPVVIVAASDANFASWLPLGGEATADCIAPIDVS